MKCRIFTALLLVALLSSCSAKEVNLPPPSEMFIAIGSAVGLPEMVDVVDELMEENTGIEPSDYDNAVYLILEVGLAPDEIVIVRAKDNAAAAAIQEKLEKRLAYKEKSAENYLTEYLPMIKNGVVRRDGLTISLIVSEHSAQIVEIYDNWK